MERRAVREGWSITQEQRQRVLARLMQTIDDSEATHRDTTAAAKAIISADMADAESSSQELHLHQHNHIPAAIAEIQRDPEYVEYLRRKALADAEQPAADGGQPQSGTLEAGETPA